MHKPTSITIISGIHVQVMFVHNSLVAQYSSNAVLAQTCLPCQLAVAALVVPVEIFATVSITEENARFQTL